MVAGTRSKGKVDSAVPLQQVWSFCLRKNSHFMFFFHPFHLYIHSIISNFLYKNFISKTLCLHFGWTAFGKHTLPDSLQVFLLLMLCSSAFSVLLTCVYETHSAENTSPLWWCTTSPTSRLIPLIAYYSGQQCAIVWQCFVASVVFWRAVQRMSASLILW